MAIKFNTVKCPECGASLPIEEGREKLFCSYCGSQIIMTNENEFVFRHVDEAKIKQAETDRTVQLKKLEIIERKRAAGERTKRTKITISIILGIVGALLMIFGGEMTEIVGMGAVVAILYIWIMNDNDKDDTDLDLGDKVKVPSSISDYESKNYAVIEAVLSSAGFTNIRCIPLCDLKTAIFKKPGTVESITINGKEIISGGKKYPCDASVVISYHSFS